MSKHFSRRFCLIIQFILLIILPVGCGAENTPPPTPTLSPLAVKGKQVFSAECARCHAVSDDTVIVGPSLVGIADRAGERVEGVSAEGYLLQSILAPNRYVVDGFSDLMPADLGKKITGEDVDAVVAYLLTLQDGE